MRNRRLIAHHSCLFLIEITFPQTICPLPAYIPARAVILFGQQKIHMPGEPGTSRQIPAVLAARVAKEIRIPVIGIGAGGDVDGQVLVMHDMLGINQGFSPRFLRRYANLAEVITHAVQQYIEDVKRCDFPNEKEQY